MHTFPSIQPLQYITIIHTNAKIAVSTFSLAQESSNSMANQRLLPASTAARLGSKGVRRQHAAVVSSSFLPSLPRTGLNMVTKSNSKSILKFVAAHRIDS